MIDIRPDVSSLPHVLYVSYDGLLEPLGESQVVSYLEPLSSDLAITVLSFEKAPDLADSVRVAAMTQRLGACGIAWARLPYHKRPPVLSTALDVLAGIRRGRAVCRREPVAIVHARGYVPSLIALGVRGASGARFLFDMRGFWIDEKVEAGHWPAGGLLHRVGKWCERRFLAAADAIVSLTARGVRDLHRLGYQGTAGAVEVIPTCVDLRRFSPGPKDPALVGALGLGDASCIVGCVGTMSNWYLRDAMLGYLAQLAIALDRSRILIVTREDPVALEADAARHGVPPARLTVTRAAFADMPRYVRLFDVGLFFIQPTLSKRGSAATKLAEFLACGVPVIINDGVGDSGEIVQRERVGVVLPDLTQASIERSLPEVAGLLVDGGVAARCRKTAADLFDLDQGVARYRALYAGLASGRIRRARAH